MGGETLEPELQAIMALCNEHDSARAKFDAGCPLCAFRRDAAIEDMTVKIKACIDSLKGDK